MEKNITSGHWYEVSNLEDVNSPSILVYPDRIERNIEKMIQIAGGPDNLRPHVKTHKMPDLIRMQMKYGISKFKCATISETEMVAKCGAKDILFAMQPVGPNFSRFFRLKSEFQNSMISCIADDENIINQLSVASIKSGMQTHVWLDINNGMNRTGIVPGKKAEELFTKISESPMLVAEGLHVYDGHIHEPDIELRSKICKESFKPVSALLENLAKHGSSDIKIIAGGTPTFPVHAVHKGVQLSPGTILLWDIGYGRSFTDLDFLNAAVLLTRIVSKPKDDLLCLDLGHKAVASEMPQPRVRILGLEDYSIVGHSEEHMIVRTDEADRFNPGDAFYCIPWHICPTIDRHDTAVIIRDNTAVDQWIIEARRRKLTI